VFRVSGTIELASDLRINNSNITIAGQTAPGDGICLKNYKLSIKTNDVIVRYLRIRRGNKSGKDDDALGIGSAENVIIDHCSISWGCDETVNTWHDVKNLTIQWSIISEALHHKSHGFAASLGGENASYHHLLFANCPGRNPSIAGNTEHHTINMDLRNNVIFNWGYRTCDGLPDNVNLVYNYYKPGPNSTLMLFARLQDEIPEMPAPAWYVYGNVMEGNERITTDNSLGVTREGRAHLVDSEFILAPVKTVSAISAYQKVLDDVGARLPKRDSVDLRIIKEATTGTPTYGNGVVMDPADVGGWPELSSAPAPTDTDNDGMPDDWELEHGLDINDPEDRNNIDLVEGYTMLEVYLNNLVEELSVGVDDFTVSDPTGFILNQNYPNPFNPVTTIKYQLPKLCQVNLNIYNILGQKVATLVSKKQHEGIFTAEWDASGFSGGIYFYRLETDKGFSQSRKLILLK
jgi:pectate lyase